MKLTRTIPYLLTLALALTMGCSPALPAKPAAEIPPTTVANPTNSLPSSPAQATSTTTPAAPPTLPSTTIPSTLEPLVPSLPATTATETGISPAETTPKEPDLTAILAQFSLPPQSSGQALILYGRVLDTSGAPLPNATVEIWQTDAQGRYDHPNAPATSQRDLAFQFYGSTTTDAQGVYAFRTLIPGEYEPRPAHIHFKVRFKGAVALTSQFYFAQDRDMLSREGLFQAAGDQGELLILDPQPVEGQPDLLAAFKDIVLLPQGSTTVLTLFPTPAQAEGPFYPRVDVSAFDNDLMVAR